MRDIIIAAVYKHGTTTSMMMTINCSVLYSNLKTGYLRSLGT